MILKPVQVEPEIQRKKHWTWDSFPNYFSFEILPNIIFVAKSANLWNTASCHNSKVASCDQNLHSHYLISYRMTHANAIVRLTCSCFHVCLHLCLLTDGLWCNHLLCVGTYTLWDLVLYSYNIEGSLSVQIMNGITVI